MLHEVIAALANTATVFVWLFLENNGLKVDCSGKSHVLYIKCLFIIMQCPKQHFYNLCF